MFGASTIKTLVQGFRSHWSGTSIHAARSGSAMYQDDINLLIWSVVAAGFLATAALTLLFLQTDPPLVVLFLLRLPPLRPTYLLSCPNPGDSLRRRASLMLATARDIESIESSVNPVQLSSETSALLLKSLEFRREIGHPGIVDETSQTSAPLPKQGTLVERPSPSASDHSARSLSRTGWSMNGSNVLVSGLYHPAGGAIAFR